MCLSRLDDTPSKLKAYKQKIGWKIFNTGVVSSRLFFQNQSFNQSYCVLEGRWLKCGPRGKIHTVNEMMYTPNFHIYLTKPYGKRPLAEIVKVKWEQATATGYQDKRPVVIARRMFVPRRTSCISK